VETRPTKEPESSENSASCNEGDRVQKLKRKKDTTSQWWTKDKRGGRREEQCNDYSSLAYRRQENHSKRKGDNYPLKIASVDSGFKCASRKRKLLEIRLKADRGEKKQKLLRSS